MSYEFYLDPEKKIINSNLLDNEAKKIAKKLVEPFHERKDKKKPKCVSKHQLRKFYNEFKYLEKQTKMFKWESTEPMVRMVKSKISYATSPERLRRNNETGSYIYYKEFRNFIIKGIDSIKDEKDLFAFCKFFEAVVGYYYGEGGK